MEQDEGGTRNLPRRHERYEGKGKDMRRGMVCGPRSLVSVVAALLVVAGWALGQPVPLQSSVFKYYVWGQIHAPGAYSLGASPDLMELLSAAGGPTEYADVKHIVLVRGTTQQRVSINLQKMLYSGQVVLLSPGDIVIVPNSAWYRVRDYLSITSTLVGFATLVVTLWYWKVL